MPTKDTPPSYSEVVGTPDRKDAKSMRSGVFVSETPIPDTLRTVPSPIPLPERTNYSPSPLPHGFAYYPQPPAGFGQYIPVGAGYPPPQPAFLPAFNQGVQPIAQFLRGNPLFSNFLNPGSPGIATYPPYPMAFTPQSPGRPFQGYSSPPPPMPNFPVPPVQPATGLGQLKFTVASPPAQFSIIAGKSPSDDAKIYFETFNKLTQKILEISNRGPSRKGIGLLSSFQSHTRAENSVKVAVLTALLQEFCNQCNKQNGLVDFSNVLTAVQDQAVKVGFDQKQFQDATSGPFARDTKRLLDSLVEATKPKPIKATSPQNK